MSPPLKRRRVESAEKLQIKDTHSHAAKHIQHVQQTQEELRTPPDHIDEVHLRIRTHAMQHARDDRQRRDLGLGISVGDGASVALSLGNPTSTGVSVSVTIGDILGTGIASEILGTAPSTSESSPTSTIASTSPSTTSTSLPSISTPPTLASTTPFPSTNGTSTSIPSGAAIGTGSFGSQSSQRNQTSSALSASGSSTGKPSVLFNSFSAPSNSSTTHGVQDGQAFTLTRGSSSYTTTISGHHSITSHASQTTSSSSSNHMETTSSPKSHSTQSSASSFDQVTGAAFGSSTTSSPSASATAHHGDNNNNDTPPAGTIAGGVVGGAAGLAVIILIAMMFLRWYRRRAQLGHQALPPTNTMSPGVDGTPDGRSAPGMAERAGRLPLMGAVPALFRHQNRSVEDTPPTGERGFTRVSGRKLPSQFSSGMTSSPPPTMPLNHQDTPDYNNASFYRDSNGFYGGTGESPPNADPFAHPLDGPSAGPGTTPEYMTLSPGPQRRPTVNHRGGPYTLNEGAAPQDNFTLPPSAHPAQATFDRAESPEDHYDSIRESRFTEQV